MLSFRTCAGAMHMRAFAQAQARTAHMRTGKLAPVRMVGIARALSTSSDAAAGYGVDVVLANGREEADTTACLIFSHGLGDTAAGWIDNVQMLADQLPWVKFVLPTARTQPVTINMGMAMPSWYDIESLGGDRSLERCEGIADSSALLGSLVADENARGIATTRIVLGGFSQGGALSLYTALRKEEGGGCLAEAPLAGVLSLSAYLPLPTTLDPVSAAELPVLLCHGDADQTVPYDMSASTLDSLKTLGVSSAVLNTYAGMGHELNYEELMDALEFLMRVVPDE